MAEAAARGSQWVAAPGKHRALGLSVPAGAAGHSECRQAAPDCPAPASWAPVPARPPGPAARPARSSQPLRQCMIGRDKRQQQRRHNEAEGTRSGNGHRWSLSSEIAANSSRGQLRLSHRPGYATRNDRSNNNRCLKPRPAEDTPFGQADRAERARAIGRRNRHTAHRRVARAGSRQADAMALHRVRGRRAAAAGETIAAAVPRQTPRRDPRPDRVRAQSTGPRAARDRGGQPRRRRM